VLTVRRAKLPLNPDAVKAADDALYQNHPELDGRKLTMGPEDGALRKEWMDAYLAAGGAIADQKEPSPPASPKVPCPTAPAAPPSPPSPVSIADLTQSTPKLGDLPDKVSIPKDLCKQMQTQWDKSIDDSGNSQEHGGTLAVDKDGKMGLVNTDHGESGSFQPSTDVPEGSTYKGTFHTHPYGKNDGDTDGAHTTFSGGDIGTLDDYHEDVSIVQSGDNKYVFVKTDKSPDSIDDDQISKDYDAISDKEYDEQIKAGKTPPEALELACDKAASEMAKKLNYGYYKGTDCSSLSRVNP
jgi:hypothetical protein